MPSKMPKNDGKGSGSSRRGKNNQQTIPSSRTSNRLLEDYQEPDTESDTSVTNYTEYSEGKEEKEAKDLKMKESEVQHEKFHKEWQNFLQLKKQVNTDFKRFQTTNFKDKAAADDAESTANQGQVEPEEPVGEPDAKAPAEQNGPDVSPAK